MGDDCALGDWCTMGGGCTLGDWCTMGGDCTLENGRVEHAAYFKVSNIGSKNRTAYAFCNTKTGEIFIRAGCWFSDAPAFIERVKSVHGGTQHEVDYLAFVKFAKARFARYLPKEQRRVSEWLARNARIVARKCRDMCGSMGSRGSR
jgi:hypothetical protein